MKIKKPYDKAIPTSDAKLIRNVMRTELDIITANTLGRFGSSRENIWSIKEAMEAKMQELARLHHTMGSWPYHKLPTKEEKKRR